jgi:hypothetical protein
MNKVDLRLMPILVVFLFGQGCVGVFTFGKHVQTINTPSVIDHAAPPSAGSLYSERKPVQEVTAVTYGADIIRSSNPTASWLREKWGDPKSIKHVATQPPQEIWTYTFGWTWGGVIPCLIVPIPLVVPTGKEKVVFVLQNGRVVSAEVTEATDHYSGFFPISPEGPYWAH